MSQEIIQGAPAGMPLRIPQSIETERLTLRCPRLDDGQMLHAAIVESAERLHPWFAWPAGAKLTLKRSVATTRFARWCFLAGRELQFLILHDERENLLGVTGLCNPDWTRRHFEISYWLRSGCEGHGYATEAVAALTAFAFQRLGGRRLEIRCVPENKAAVALPLKLGYTLEKVLPRAQRGHNSGTWHDVAVFVRMHPRNCAAPWPTG
mgnify:CR=1 FL=1